MKQFEDEPIFHIPVRSMTASMPVTSGRRITINFPGVLPVGDEHVELTFACVAFASAAAPSAMNPVYVSGNTSVITWYRKSDVFTLSPLRWRIFYGKVNAADLVDSDPQFVFDLPAGTGSLNCAGFAVQYENGNIDGAAGRSGKNVTSVQAAGTSGSDLLGDGFFQTLLVGAPTIGDVTIGNPDFSLFFDGSDSNCTFKVFFLQNILGEQYGVLCPLSWGIAGGAYGSTSWINGETY